MRTYCSGSRPHNVSSAPLSFASCCGFTLLELLVVLLVIGIAAGITGIIIGKQSSGVEIKKVSREIAATLRVARSRAVSEKKAYYFALNNKSRTYGLYDYRINVNKKLQNLKLTEGLPKDIWLVNYNDIAEDLFQIEFTPYGSSSGGMVEIRDDSRKYTITINRLTGRVSIEKAEISR